MGGKGVRIRNEGRKWGGIRVRIKKVEREKDKKKENGKGKL